MREPDYQPMVVRGRYRISVEQQSLAWRRWRMRPEPKGTSVLKEEIERLGFSAAAAWIIGRRLILRGKLEKVLRWDGEEWEIVREPEAPTLDLGIVLQEWGWPGGVESDASLQQDGRAKAAEAQTG